MSVAAFQRTAHRDAMVLTDIRVSGIVGQSVVDGPGMRMVIFTQGCPHHCLGCHNPHTHDLACGSDYHAEDILAQFDRNPLLAGMTLSGGEPFLQAEGLVGIAAAVRARGKNVWCYSGYTFEELHAWAARDTAVRHLCEHIDVLVDGRYDSRRRNLSLRFRGSDNQRVIDMPVSLLTGYAVSLDS